MPLNSINVHIAQFYAKNSLDLSLFFVIFLHIDTDMGELATLVTELRVTLDQQMAAPVLAVRYQKNVDAAPVNKSWIEKKGRFT